MHHIFNTNFEWELEKDRNTDLEHSFSKIHKKLLPLGKLFAKPGDTVFPEKPIPGQTVNSWAPSMLIKKYAEKHNLIYTLPSWEHVRKIQSKEFAHALSPLFQSCILHNSDELDAWLKKVPHPHVFKSFYGFSGTGHKFKTTNLLFPVLAEPWVDRSFDFSTQWEITKDKMNYLGATVLISDERGRYKETLVSSDEKKLFKSNYPFLQEQIAFIKNCAHHFPPFFGNIGFDAFVYDNRLQPICEINARKTFGYLALFLLKNHPEQNSLCLSFDKEKGLTYNFLHV